MSTKSQIISRDIDGFFNCKGCQKKFFTKVGLKVHSCNEQKKNTFTKLDQLQQSPTKNDETDFQEKSGFEIKSHLWSSSFVCQECNKYFSHKTSLQTHIDIVHKKLLPFQCQECKTYLRESTYLK